MTLFPYNRSQLIRILFIVALFAIVIRVILDSRFATSSLLYLAVPFAVSVLIHQFIPCEVENTLGRQLFNHLRDATVVMLATSLILFEGFICVLMFMPIYYLCALIHYAFAWEIFNVGDDFERTNVAKNTSYLASYVQIDGTEVNFCDVGEGQTEVSLTVHYHRKLDPAWYFGPLQNYAFERSAAYLIDTVIAHK